LNRLGFSARPYIYICYIMRRMREFLSIQAEIKHIAQTISWYRFSNGLIGVFIPLVILQSGGALLVVAGFYLIFALVKLIADLPAIVLIQHRGARFGLSASFLFYALQLVSILGYVNGHHFIFLAIGAINLGLIDAFGDNARHIYVSSIMEHRNKSSSMATMEILGQIADLAGPLAGAVIGIWLGPDWLLLVALTCLVFTVRPLAKIHKSLVLDKSIKLRFSLKNAPIRDCIADGAFGSEETVSRNLWPVYLAVMLGTFTKIGIVTAISVLGTIVAVWMAGRLGDRGRNQTVLGQGVAGMSIINWLRLIATTFGPITLLGTGYSIAQGYALNGLNSTYYSHAKDKGLKYIVSIELASDIGYLATWAVLFAVLSLFDSSRIFFVTGFIIAAVVIWGALLYTPYNRLHVLGVEK
jgi:MFS family permease